MFRLLNKIRDWFRPKKRFEGPFIFEVEVCDKLEPEYTFEGIKVYQVPGTLNLERLKPKVKRRKNGRRRKNNFTIR